MTKDLTTEIDFTLITQDDLPQGCEEKAIKEQKLANLMKAIESSSITLVECCEKAGLKYSTIKTQKSLGQITWASIDKLSQAFFILTREAIELLNEARSTFLKDNSNLYKEIIEQTEQKIKETTALKDRLEKVS